MTEAVQTAAILAAGGSGKRMGGPLPKQLIPLGGRSALARSLEKLAGTPEVRCIVAAVSPPCADAVRDWVRRNPSGPPVVIVEAGAERQDTVYRGLRAVPEDADIVLVHDAARPFVSVPRIRETIAAAARNGAAILAVRPKATVKRGGGDRVEETLDRRLLWEAQTPQAFRAGILVRAYESAMKDGFAATDDAALVERLGLPVEVVEGEETNIKITTPFDWIVAERLAAEGL
ncbi:MAG: 2-C-methyl-D-erythritol 4-phosphate cytidylyltransferase [bacterium]|nr:2-C-methyl-D-erythritol 4-phosphate cytidylyltransferase [bacterium]